MWQFCMVGVLQDCRLLFVQVMHRLSRLFFVRRCSCSQVRFESSPDVSRVARASRTRASQMLALSLCIRILIRNSTLRTRTRNPVLSFYLHFHYCICICCCTLNWIVNCHTRIQAQETSHQPPKLTSEAHKETPSVRQVGNRRWGRRVLGCSCRLRSSAPEAAFCVCVWSLFVAGGCNARAS